MRNLTSTLNKLTFSLMLAGYKACPPHWSRKGKKPKHHSLWFITKGNGEVVLNGKKDRLCPGKLIVFTPEMVCDKKVSGTNPLEFYFVRFSYALAFEEKDRWHFKQSGDAAFPLNGVYTINNSSAVVLLLEQLNALSKRRGATISMQQKVVFQELLLTFIEDFHSQSISGDSKKAIEGTIEYMVNHYKNSITLPELANIAGLSVSHYSRLFKKYIGLSPIDYLTHLRIDRAKELLVLSDIRIKEVSQNVGYVDELYFSRTFKRIVGISPSQFCDDQKLISQ
ncbi:helix-turn-helix transcriptional regulator [Bacillus sp. IB182487]|uniref:Helix-turn-helix transcriptional regulator n=2 Tax=Metabacillus arenae TaxID=2771434 RepID=A0A926N9T8_9BACI|nr:helix-turn-helix transcriptional regulator [Metabacillus arenae]